MRNIKDGGPAFPVQDAATWQAHGMTLRDYFAAHATEQDIQAYGEFIRKEVFRFGHPVELSDDWRVTARYMHADAMLEEREAK